MYEFEKNKLKAYIGKKQYELFKSYRCILAGGAITSLFTNKPINDLDIYFRCKDDVMQFFVNEIMSTNIWVLANTKKAFLFKQSQSDVLIQLIYFQTFKTAEDIFDTFDFTACMGAYDFDKEEFVFHDDFFKANSQRHLMFNSSTAFPLVSALRVEKYKEKGYSISKTEYLRILLTCMNLHIDNYEDLKDQLGGMYGVDYDEIIQPKEDEEFDLPAIIERMSQIIYSPDYFKPLTTQKEIEPTIAYIYRILGETMDVYKCKDKLLTVVNGYFEDITSDVDLKTDNVRLMELSELFKPGFKLYKIVSKKGRRYFSNFDGKFEYVPGEFAVGKGVTYYPKKNVGIFGFQTIGETIESRGPVSKNEVIIELEVESANEIININSDNAIEVSRAKFTREVPAEEYDKEKQGCLQ